LRCAPANGVDIGQCELDARLRRQCQEMQTGIGRAADCRCYRGGVSNDSRVKKPDGRMPLCTACNKGVGRLI
jgi:hypothetical protein